MFKYLLATGITLLTSVGLLSNHIKKREEALKTSKCLKCSGGVGKLKNSKNGKYSYECCNCKSIWVERR